MQLCKLFCGRSSIADEALKFEWFYEAIKSRIAMSHD